MKRTLALAAMAFLLVLGLAWSVKAIQDLRAQVADQGGRIALLERR